LYREQRAQERGPAAVTLPADEKFAGISVVHHDGSTAPLDIARIRTIVAEACEGLIDVDAERIIDESL